MPCIDKRGNFCSNDRTMKKARKKIHPKTVFGIAALICAALAALFLVTLLVLAKNLPSVEDLQNHAVRESTKIYDRTGTTLLYETNDSGKRTVVPLSDIPQFLRNATISIEDEKFYTEPAFDWKGIARALLTNLASGRILQGGSTITQQLAKNSFLSDERTILRKLKELLLAIQLDKRYSKDRILELYLNEIAYGPSLYGVESASEAYFGKPVKNLSLAEAAVLAALPQAPSYYSPWGSHTKDLMARQKLVLQKMYDLGKISKSDFAAAKKEQLAFSPQNPKGILAPHFVMGVMDYLTQKYGDSMVRVGGLKVTTTLDWNLQQIAEKAVSDGAAQNETLYSGKNAALVAQDAKTGQILSMVGSRDYFDIQNGGNFNVATQGLRQPGSALKPFVYMTAFSKGYTPDTVLFDVPTEFSTYPDCPAVPDYKDDNPHCFHPENFDGIFRGPVTLRTALAQSINIPAVKTLYLSKIADVVKNANAFGLNTLDNPNRYGLSLVLGGGAVKLVDLVEAYSVLAQEGTKHNQTMVLEVRDQRGNVLETFNDQSAQVIDPEYPRIIDSILSDSTARAGLFQNSLSLTVFPNHDVAMKTGTSNDYRDAWTVGYTPSLVVGVWAGNNDNSPMQRHGSSILAAVPIWHAFMDKALQNQPTETFTRPDSLAPEKPFLRGDYTYGNQIHTVLYYVDKNNPTGAPPQDPTADSQFNNWETGVINWAKTNVVNFGSLNQGATPAAVGSQAFVVSISSPQSGSFVNGDISVRAHITNGTTIKNLSLSWNDEVIKTWSGDFGTAYDLDYQFSASSSAQQNNLTVTATDGGNQSASANSIVYGGQ